MAVGSEAGRLIAVCGSILKAVRFNNTCRIAWHWLSPPGLPMGIVILPGLEHHHLVGGETRTLAWRYAGRMSGIRPGLRASRGGRELRARNNDGVAADVSLGQIDIVFPCRSTTNPALGAKLDEGRFERFLFTRRRHDYHAVDVAGDRVAQVDVAVVRELDGPRKPMTRPRTHRSCAWLPAEHEKPSLKISRVSR